MENVAGILLDCMIDRAEQALVDYKSLNTKEHGFRLIFEGVVIEMYEQRRIEFESMMQQPFRAALPNA